MSAAAEGKRDTLEQKSLMLDEVNQLLDLMVGEKVLLQKRIHELEKGGQQSMNDKEKEQEPLMTVYSKDTLKHIIDLITKERGVISTLNQRITDIQCTITNDHANTARSLKSEINQLQLTVREQKREIKRLQEDCTNTRSKYEQLLYDDKKREGELDNMKMKYNKTRTALLALKGRTALELRRKEEERIQDIKRLEMDTIPNIEQRLKAALHSSIKDKDTTIEQLTVKLHHREEEIQTLSNQLKSVKMGVSNQLMDLERELQLSRTELTELNEVLKSQKEELSKTKEMLKHERRQSHLLLTTTQSSLTRLLSQVDKERNEHIKEVHTLHVAMATQRQEDKLKLDRLRDASIKRCGLLAKEVWSLKNKN